MVAGDEENNGRLMVQCTECGSAYAARRTGDDTLLPIGARNGCSCGNSTFVEVEGETILEFGADDDTGGGN